MGPTGSCYVRAVTRPTVAWAISMLLLAAPAWGARGWQPTQDVPNGRVSSVDGADERGVAIDASGNAIFGVSMGNGKYGYVTRAHAGAPSTATQFPNGTQLPDTPGLFGMDGAGNVLDWSGQWSAYRPVGGAFGAGAVTSSWSLVDVAVAPTGEALGLFSHASGAWVAFRPAGAGQAFDVANATELPNAAGDTTAQPIGIAIDPDGAAIAVYTSSHPSSSLTYLQSVRPAGGSFQNPTTIPSWPAAAGMVFDNAADGTSVVATISGSSVIAAVRPPGGSFGAFDTIGTAPIGGNLAYVRAAAANGGAIVGWSEQLTGSNGCSAGSGNEQGWRAAAYYDGSWHPRGPGLGPITLLNEVDALDATGSTVALLVSETTGQDVGDGCHLQNYSSDLVAYVGSLQDLGAAHTLVTYPFSLAATFIAAGAGGDALAGWSDDAMRVAAFEDPTTSAGGGGGGGGGDTTPPPGGSGGDTTTPPGGGSSPPPSGGGSTPITAPAKVVLKGPVVVKEKVAPIPFHCNTLVECNLVIDLFQISHATRARAKVKAKPIGHGHGRVKAGKTGVVKAKLTKTALRLITKAKHHRLKVRIVAKVTTGGHTSKLTATATLKRG